MVGDDVNRWRFKLGNFDNDMEGGRNLNDDLNVSSVQHAVPALQPHTHSSRMPFLA